MFKEFKEFALKGNMVDMAIGIVIGGAFGTVVKSLVTDIIMPPIGVMTGGMDFSNIRLTLKGATADAEAVAMNIGLFVNSIIAFLIVAFALFIVVKAMNNLRKKEEAAPAAPTAPPRSELLLEEIRDALKARG